ncbi:hypothetical protein DAPPUDRAFT_326689 [Daphnia pulex]|uniref:Uncharacterized protein n=1 Tax=Daphnia pulex TaxID=6669 RepID=E9H8H9_DAPPU|nr:hypothetical protein DAPPUDRAFT_326689 [Daphnia pulex]|eukprot:EFX71947.1 hypothetical protein DAPPUDRAFT_326689 [Daphnia pulex]
MRPDQAFDKASRHAQRSCQEWSGGIRPEASKSKTRGSRTSGREDMKEAPKRCQDGKVA